MAWLMTTPTRHPTHADPPARRQARAKLNKGRRGSHHLLVFQSDTDEAETFDALSAMHRTPTHARTDGAGEGMPRMSDALGYTSMGDVASEMKDHVAATVRARGQSGRPGGAMAGHRITHRFRRVWPCR